MANLLDSGERQSFDTGAVRDIQEGKGRCDLLPLDVITQFSRMERYEKEEKIFNLLHAFQLTGNAEYFLDILYSASNNYIFKDASTMFLEVSIHYEDGARKYGVDNWKKGIPVSRYISSAVRHYLKWLRKDDDEPHDRAFVWNIMAAAWTCMNMPELNDYKKGNMLDDMPVPKK